MRNIVRKVAATLTYGTIIAVLAAPANAAGLGVGAGASVGGSGGVNAGVGASVGGGSGVNAGVGASVGGANGVDANATASVGGSTGINANVGANIGDGINAGVDANVGDSANATLGLGIGDDGIGGLSPLGTPNTLGIPGTPAVKDAVAQMSGTKLTRMKKRCTEVLSSEGTYDKDLRALCLMISRR